MTYFLLDANNNIFVEGNTIDNVIEEWAAAACTLPHELDNHDVTIIEGKEIKVIQHITIAYEIAG